MYRISIPVTDTSNMYVLPKLSCPKQRVSLTETVPRAGQVSFSVYICSSIPTPFRRLSTLMYGASLIHEYAEFDIRLISIAYIFPLFK